MKKAIVVLTLIPLLGACATPLPPVPTIAESLAEKPVSDRAKYLQDECFKEASHKMRGQNGQLGHAGTAHIDRLKQICAEIPNVAK